MWNNTLSLSILEKIALDELLCGKILPHLHSIQANVHEAIIRTERVVASIYGVWTGPSVTGDRRYGFFVFYSLLSLFCSSFTMIYYFPALNILIQIVFHALAFEFVLFSGVSFHGSCIVILCFHFCQIFGSCAVSLIHFNSICCW